MLAIAPRKRWEGEMCKMKSIHARLPLLFAAINANLELEGTALDGIGKALFYVSMS